MATRRSDQQPLCRYVVGGTTEYTNGKLKWWERKILPTADTDVEFTVTTRYAGRPDLLAYDAYGSVQVMWAILQYNNIIDPFSEFVVGATIKLPTASRMFNELLKA